MSKIGKQPIQIPEGVEIRLENDGKVSMKGPRGALELSIPPKMRKKIEVILENNLLKVERVSEEKQVKAMHGTIRAHLMNMINGVTKGWEKKLEIIGTGYLATKEGEALVLKLRYSHNVRVDSSEGIVLDTDGNIITISGVDKALVGQMANKIRHIQPPDHYKGKGIRYLGEVIKLKPGKAATKGVEAKGGGAQ